MLPPGECASLVIGAGAICPNPAGTELLGFSFLWRGMKECGWVERHGAVQQPPSSALGCLPLAGTPC
jgi:hypothetical protein